MDQEAIGISMLAGLLASYALALVGSCFLGARIARQRSPRHATKIGYFGLALAVGVWPASVLPSAYVAGTVFGLTATLRTAHSYPFGLFCFFLSTVALSLLATSLAAWLAALCLRPASATPAGSAGP